MKLKIGTTLLLLVILSGCNKDKDEVTIAPEQAPTEQDVTGASTNNQNTTNTATEAPFNFSEFSLDVDYSATESYEVDYENDQQGVEASISDSRNNVSVQGDDAYAQLEPLFKQLDFDVTASDEDVLAQVMSLFSIGEDYQKIELDITFADGTEREYRKMK